MPHGFRSASECDFLLGAPNSFLWNDFEEITGNGMGTPTAAVSFNQLKESPTTMDFEHQKLSRASLLRSLAAAPIAIGALAALQAEADAKMGATPQSAVQYQSKPKGGAQCSQCRFFIKGKTKTAVGACTQIAGKIAPTGWCVVFAKGDNSKNTM